MNMTSLSEGAAECLETEAETRMEIGSKTDIQPRQASDATRLMQLA